MEQKNSQNLEGFRKEIDQIDKQLVTLFQKRLEVVKKVKALKDKSTSVDFSLHIKPDREFEMIEKMKAEELGYNKNFLPNIWRTIISASNLTEQSLEFGALSAIDKFYASSYFGNLKKPQIYDAQTAFEKLEENKIHILSFQQHNEEAYQCLKKNEKIKIFAGIKTENGKFVFLCGKMEQIENYFNEKSWTITTQQTACQIANGVYTKQTDNTNNGFIFGYFYEHSWH